MFTDEQKKEVRARLDEKIPRDVISLRDGGGGRKLSYLEGHYVIARLNEIFGQGNWSYITEELTLAHSGEVEGKYGNTHSVHYLAKMRLEVPSLGCIFVDYGYGDGSDKANPGKAHELAAKEAVTDGLKRCAKSLGMSTGLALYSKEQENVDDGQTEVCGRGQAAAKQSGPGKADPGGPEKVKPPSVGSPDRVGAAATEASAPVAKEGGPSAPKSREEVNTKISEYSRVVVAKKTKTVPELKAFMEEKYGATDKAQLSDAQAGEFLNYLKTLTK